MRFFSDIKHDRLPLIKASALKMMVATGKTSVACAGRIPEKVKEVFQDLETPEESFVPKEQPLTPEEKDFCGIV